MLFCLATPVPALRRDLDATKRAPYLAGPRIKPGAGVARTGGPDT